MPAKNFIKYHNDGTIWAKGKMVDGLPTGYWEWFRKEGTLMRSGYFKDGKQTRECTTSDKMLVLPNIWDPLGALLMEDLGYSVIATASAAIAYTNGYNDKEKIPFSDLLELLKKITASVNLPVTADIESGYAENDNQLQE